MIEQIGQHEQLVTCYDPNEPVTWHAVYRQLSWILAESVKWTDREWTDFRTLDPEKFEAVCKFCGVTYPVPNIEAD